MSTCGLVNFDQKTGHGTGRIRTLQLALDIALEPTGNKGDGDKPSHTVYARGAHGQMCEIGAAWEKKGERGSIAGKRFYSFTVDDPSLPAPMNLHLFPNPNYDAKAAGPDVPAPFDVVWRRERGEGRAA